MALSDLHPEPAVWSINPLLNSKVQAPRFLRTQWDEASARAFGPWRVAEKIEPTEGLTTELPVTHNEVYPTTDETDLVTSEATATAVETESPWTDAALEALRDEAYQRGLLEGQAKVREEHETERSKERELVRHLGIELRSISQDPQRFFEPLKRLSLHLAEQLVRAELQLSGQAIHNLVQACIQQLDHAALPVHVSVNPEDLQRLKEMGKSVTDHMQLEPDTLLRPGSVRVRVQDSVVQDLIENRLEPLARRLLAQPEAWMQQSSLVKERAEALPADTPSRDWSRQVLDVEDVEDSDIKSPKPPLNPSAPPPDDTHDEL
ncbi:FliH/SctL family protein [Limnohabitans sp. Rim8]|uniref:FliH/SctL family protein n=1 Tax=Limnohabitans sp. Rim8 TaxID=1100718 RepID=UPI0025F9ED29|nr:FliH/SctL family protein [Limnohabitans sp. Rim8]